MKADAITKKILEDARRASAQTLDDANRRAEALKKQSEDKLAQTSKLLDVQIAEDAEVMRSRMLRMAELEARKEQLGAKREVIDQVFDTVLGAMRSMPEDQQVNYNKRMLLEAASGGEEILCDKTDQGLFSDKLIADVNAELAKAGKKPLTLSKESRQTGGGFVLKQGGLEVNCCYEALLDTHRQSMEAEVAHMLFDGPEEVK